MAVTEITNGAVVAKPTSPFEHSSIFNRGAKPQVSPNLQMFIKYLMAVVLALSPFGHFNPTLKLLGSSFVHNS